MKNVYLAIDFGGTRTRAALFDDANQMLERTETLTQVAEGQNAVIKRLITIGKSLLSDDIHLQAVGVAAPGPLDTRTGTILHAKTLPGWQNVPLKNILQHAFNVPVFVQNDGNLGALSEYHLGAGRGADPMIYLTISTGIGGGAIINGGLFTGHSALAIEPGHMRLTLPDGSHRRLEELASGTALGKQAITRLQKTDLPSSLREIPSDTIDGKAVGMAAQSSDEFALQIVHEAGTYLGLGLVNLLHLFNPAAIIMGGSVMQLDHLILDPARNVIREHILDAGFFNDTLLRKAAIEEDMCLYGAMLHARQNIH